MNGTGIETLRRYWPGLAPCLAITLLAEWLARQPPMQRHGIGALTIAMGLGVLAGNLSPAPWQRTAAAGLLFGQRRLLRFGVALFGLHLTAAQVIEAGTGGLLADVLMIVATLAIGYWIGTRCLGMDRETTLLVSAGSAICGAAAVMAAEPVLRAPPARVAIAVATVTLFGSLAIVVYPLLYPFAGFAPERFGTYVGSTVHEVAQVVAVGRDLSPAVADRAVVVKLIRVLLLAPALLLIGRLARTQRAEGGRLPTAQVPLFALGFIAAAGLRSMAVLPAPLTNALLELDTALLAMAMAALGFGAHRRLLREAGLRPLALGALLFAWLIAGGWAINAGLALPSR